MRGASDSHTYSCTRRTEQSRLCWHSIFVEEWKIGSIRIRRKLVGTFQENRYTFRLHGCIPLAYSLIKCKKKTKTKKKKKKKTTTTTINVDEAAAVAEEAISIERDTVGVQRAGKKEHLKRNETPFRTQNILILSCMKWANSAPKWRHTASHCGLPYTGVYRTHPIQVSVYCNLSWKTRSAKGNPLHSSSVCAAIASSQFSILNSKWSFITLSLSISLVFGWGSSSIS